MKVFNKVFTKVLQKVGTKDIVLKQGVDLLPTDGLLFKALAPGLTDSIGISGIACKAVSLYFDGNDFASIGTLTIVGDFDIEWKSIIKTAFANNVVFGEDTSDNYLKFSGAAGLGVKIAGTFAGVSFGQTLLLDTEYLFRVSRRGANVTAYVDGVAGSTVAISSGNYSLKYIGKAQFAAYFALGYIWDMLVTDSSGVVFKNNLAQGAGTLCASEAGTDATITGAVWNESLIFGHNWNQTGYHNADGTGTYAENAKLPLSFSGSESGESFVGPLKQSLTIVGESTGSFSGTAYSVLATESPEMYALTVAAGVDTDFYSGGSAVALTPDDWLALATDGVIGNCIFIGNYKILGYNPALSSALDIGRARRYVGI